MFELNETLELNELTLTWVDRTYQTERGLRRFLATLTPEQLAEAEVLVDDDTFVVFYPVAVPATKTGPDGAFHYDLGEDGTSRPAAGRSECRDSMSVTVKVELETSEAEEARRKAERVTAFNILLAGVRL